MNFGTVLILVGVILAVVDLFVDLGGRFGRASLLSVAVILIGVGVLVGAGGLSVD